MRTEGFSEVTGSLQLHACLEQESGYIEETGPCDSSKTTANTDTRLYAKNHTPH